MSFPVSLDGQTYDIKQFLRDHPGGANTLLNYKGKSILHAMEKFGHSTSAYHLLRDFKVSNDVNLVGSVSENGRIITKEESSRNVEEIAFLEELETKLDYSKPILSQLELIAPHYDQWVNSAVYRRCKLFESPILDSLSYTPWYLVPLFWVPVILYMGVTKYFELVRCADTCKSDSLSTISFIYYVAKGLALWSLMEYTLHRWVFHFSPGSNITVIKMHFLLHGIHHKTPFDGLRQVFPPFAAAIIAYVLYTMLSPLLAYPVITSMGAVTGYLSYDLIHYYVHHCSPKDGSYLYAMKRYHSNHHFVNHDKAFGVSSTFWDHAFNTFVHLRKLTFSLRW